EKALAGDLCVPSVRDGRRAHVVRSELSSSVEALRRLHRQTAERREAHRPSSGATDQVQAGHKSQDRQGARPHDTAHGARPRRRGDRMRRRQLLLTGPAALALMAVRPALPQQATGGRPRRIGCLFYTPPLSDPAAKRPWAAFLEGLREYGWVEGQNLLIEGRWVEGHTE